MVRSQQVSYLPCWLGVLEYERYGFVCLIQQSYTYVYGFPVPSPSRSTIGFMLNSS